MDKRCIIASHIDINICHFLNRKSTFKYKMAVSLKSQGCKVVLEIFQGAHTSTPILLRTLCIAAGAVSKIFGPTSSLLVSIALSIFYGKVRSLICVYPPR